MCKFVGTVIIVSIALVALPFVIFGTQNVALFILAVLQPNQINEALASFENKVINNNNNNNQPQPSQPQTPIAQQKDHETKKVPENAQTRKEGHQYQFFNSDESVPLNIVKYFESFKELEKKDDLGSLNFATVVNIGGKILIIPALNRVGLTLRDSRLVPVSNVTVPELDHGTTQGKTFMNIFLVIEAYMRVTKTKCMAMHHLSGYKGEAKRIAGIIKNDGKTFVAAINPVINGYTKSTHDVKITPILCPKKTLPSKVRYGVSLNYIRYENVYNLSSDSLYGSKDSEPLVDHDNEETQQRSFGKTQNNPDNEDGEDESEGTDTSENQEDNTKRENLTNKRSEVDNFHSKMYVPIENEWFEGETAACLQLMEAEFEGEDVCLGKNIYDVKGEDKEAHKTSHAFRKNIVMM